MDATTTRASTVIRSMPTSDTRTQASMTTPLSEHAVEDVDEARTAR